MSYKLLGTLEKSCTPSTCCLHWSWTWTKITKEKQQLARVISCQDLVSALVLEWVVHSLNLLAALIVDLLDQKNIREAAAGTGYLVSRTRQCVTWSEVGRHGINTALQIWNCDGQLSVYRERRLQWVLLASSLWESEIHTKQLYCRIVSSVVSIDTF
jgi:hypothetical protein